MKISKSNRIVITGIGPISSAGIGKDEFWKGLCHRKLNITEVSYKLDNKEWKRFKKFCIKEFNINKFGLEAHLLEAIYQWKEGGVDNDLFYLLAAAKLSLDDSKLKYDPDQNRIGLIVAHENPGLEDYFSTILDNSFNYFLNSFDDKRSKISFFQHMFEKMLKKSYELQTFMPVFHIAKTLKLHGYSLFINNACASGAFALEEAKNIIVSGQCDAVVIVAADKPEVYKYLWFERLNMYSKSGVMRPFSNNADGFLIGDGAAALVIESYDSAVKRSAPIYAEYIGGSFTLESWKVTLPAPHSNYYEETIKTVFQRTKIKSKDVDIIIPHGVCTRLNDKYEMQAFEKIFGQHISSQAILLPLKPFFGHSLGANALLEIAALMLMFEKGQVLPFLNRGRDEKTPLFKIIPHLSKKEISLGLKTTCAFAGFDSALLFRNLTRGHNV